MIIVKVAPAGERVIEVSVEKGATVAEVLSIAGISDNGRDIFVNNKKADISSTISKSGTIVALATKQKGGL